MFTRFLNYFETSYRVNVPVVSHFSHDENSSYAALFLIYYFLKGLYIIVFVKVRTFKISSSEFNNTVIYSGNV